MLKNRKKVISLILTTLLITSTTFTTQTKAAFSSSANPDVNSSPITSTDVQKELQDAASNYLKESRTDDASKKITESQKKKNDTENLAPDDDVRLIVQLDGKAVTDYMPGVQIAKAGINASLKTKVLNSQVTAKKQVTSIRKGIKVKDSYSVLLNGFSVQAKGKDIAKIKALPGVKHVTVCRQFYTNMNYATNITNVQNVWDNLKLKGEGQVVAIIDTGIDMNHKDMKITDTSKEKLKPATGFNDKVPYGYNFADGNTDIKAAAGTSEHGMHVAGIVGANGDSSQVASNLAIKGCAPEAQLLAMKVFSNNPGYTSAFSDDIIAAIEDSVAHKADVLNMSLGSPAAFQDPESAEQVAVNEANANGTVCVISAGNSQYALAPNKFGSDLDDGTVGDPGVAKDSLSVASYENTNITSYGVDYKTADGQTNSSPLPYTMCSINPVDALNSTDGYDVVDAGYGAASDYIGKTVKGKIALVERGNSITFVDKQKNAQNAGAVGLIVYDNTAEGLISMATDTTIKIPAVFISNGDGLALEGKLAGGLKVFFKGSVTTVKNPAAGQMSDFSSWGPTPELDIKPEVTAPGGNIWSTVNNNKYENMSGTSMASPHAAGIAALVSEHLADILPNVTSMDKANLDKELIINTAVPQLDATAPQKIYYSPRRQGAGLVNAYNAIENNVTITTDTSSDPQAVFALKQIDSNMKKFTLYFHNYGSKDVTYKCNDLSGVMTEQSAKQLSTMSYDVPLKDAGISFSQPTVTVKAGSVSSVDVTLTLPSAATNNYVEGYLNFTDTASVNPAPAIGTTYMGFYGKWADLPIVDAPKWDSNNLLGYTSLYAMQNVGGTYSYYDLSFYGYDDNGNVVSNPNVITISNKYNTSINVTPFVSFLRNSKAGSVQLLDSNKKVITTFADTSNTRKDIASSETQPVQVPGSIQSGNMQYGYMWNGELYDPNTGNTNYVADGQYYIRLNNVVDYPGAATQTIDLPVKYDTVAPTLGDAYYSNGRVYFKADDATSSVFGAVYMIDRQSPQKGNLEICKDQNGNKLDYDPSTKLYSFPVTMSKGRHEIDFDVYDCAGNACTYKALFTSDSSIVISSPSDNSIISSNSLTVNYTLPADELTNGNQAYIAKDPIAYSSSDPYALAAYKQIPNDSTSYTFSGLYTGNHKFQIAILNSDKTKVIDTNYVSVSYPYSNSSKMAINITYPKVGTVYGISNMTLFGTLSEVPTKFEIMGKDAMQYISPGSLSFTVPITLAEGLNKISFYAQGSSPDDYQSYSLNVYSDHTAPTINFTSPDISFDKTTVINTDKNTYEFKGSVEDSSFGYIFSINQQVIKTVRLDVPDPAHPEKTLYNFDQKYDLHFGTNKFVFSAQNIGYLTTEKTIIINCTNPSRIAGSTRVDTAIEASKKGWNTSDYAVLVNGSAYSDGLVAATLAKAYDAPILFTQSSSKNPQVESSVTSELARLNTKKVFIIGGTGVVPQKVQDELSKYNPERISGTDRYDTSVKVAKYLIDNKKIDGSSAVIANGYGYADALSVSSYAAVKGYPIILVNKDALPDTVSDYLKNLKINSCYVVGGTGVISDALTQKLPGTVKRFAGQNRYDTNVAILSKLAVDCDYTNVYVASGETYADAITASALAAKNNAPIILVGSYAPNANTKNLIKTKYDNIDNFYVLGGNTVVKDNIIDQLIN